MKLPTPNAAATCLCCGIDQKIGENGENVCYNCDGALTEFNDLPTHPPAAALPGKERQN